MEEIKLDVVRRTFLEWLKLLKYTKNEHMLKDPYNIWVEAFHVGTILSSQSGDEDKYNLDKLIQEQKQEHQQLVRKDNKE